MGGMIFGCANDVCAFSFAIGSYVVKIPCWANKQPITTANTRHLLGVFYKGVINPVLLCHLVKQANAFKATKCLSFDDYQIIHTKPCHPFNACVKIALTYFDKAVLGEAIFFAFLP